MTHHNIDDMAYDMTRARAQAVSDVEEERAERERRRRVAEENRAAYDAAQESNRLRRGGSVSKMEWTPAGGTFSNTAFGPQTGMMPMREQFDWGMQSRVGADFADLARRSSMAQMHNVQIGVDSLSAAMRAALANGGRLPQNLVGILSRNLGLDGKNSSVFSAGFLGNGDFDIDIVTRGANGGLQRTTKKITPREQYGIVNSTPGVWGNDGIAVSQRLYDGLRNTMGKSELPPQGVYVDNLRAYNTKKENAEMQKFLISCAQEAIKAASKADPRSGTRVDPKTAFLQRALLNDKVRAEITQGTEPELDKDGNPVIGDDGNQVMKPASDEVQRLRLEDLANRAFMFFQGGQGGPQGGRAEAQMQVVNQILNRLYPPTPPDVAAFQQRQRERQMRQVEEAQAREDIMRRPQQVINYFKDGRWYSGNGYIRDGKVYDGQGYEIEGATPAEMARKKHGSVYSNENGWVARALPSARELVSGRGGAEVQGGGVQGGGVNWTPGHDLRNDGKTYKGTGWLGVLRLPNGGVASEYTVGVEIGGKEIDIPTLVPTLTKEEQDLMVNDIIPNNKDIPDSIMKKAVDFAKMRLANGRSVFANDGAPQQAAQGGATSATSDIDAKKKQLATMEAELKRRQSVSEMAQEIDSQRNASLEGPRVGKTDDGDYVSSVVGGVKLDMNSIPRNDKDAEEDLRKNELVIVKRISGRGGEVWHDEDGGVHARIGNFEYLPKDEQGKYRDGIVSGLPLDSIDDIQRRADVAAKDVAARREKNLQRLRSEARSKFQTEGERIAYVNKKDKEWRIENDPAFKNPDQAARTEASASSNLMTFFP